jgi:hypothetical protein
MNARLRLLPIILVATLGARAVGADEVEDRFRRFAVTISPLHLALPVVEVTAEYMVMSHLGIAAVGGVGSITTKVEYTDGSSKNIQFSAQEAGGQVRLYPFRAYRHGLQVGGEVLWLHVSGKDGVGASGTSAGTAVGPFVGYKYTASYGLTFDSQVGFEFLAAQAEAKSTNGGAASGKTTGAIALLNLNVGWSF